MRLIRLQVTTDKRDLLVLGPETCKICKQEIPTRPDRTSPTTNAPPSQNWQGPVSLRSQYLQVLQIRNANESQTNWFRCRCTCKLELVKGTSWSRVLKLAGHENKKCRRAPTKRVPPMMSLQVKTGKQDPLVVGLNASKFCKQEMPMSAKQTDPAADAFASQNWQTRPVGPRS